MQSVHIKKMELWFPVVVAIFNFESQSPVHDQTGVSQISSWADFQGQRDKMQVVKIFFPPIDTVCSMCGFLLVEVSYPDHFLFYFYSIFPFRNFGAICLIELYHLIYITILWESKLYKVTYWATWTRREHWFSKPRIKVDFPWFPS